MKSYNIQILPEAEEFLEYLPAILQESGYKDDYSYAVAYVDEIINFIYEIPNAIHHNILVKHISNNWIEGHYLRG